MEKLKGVFQRQKEHSLFITLASWQVQHSDKECCCLAKNRWQMVSPTTMEFHIVRILLLHVVCQIFSCLFVKLHRTS